MRFASILAQAAGIFAEGPSKAMGIVILIGFIFGTICAVGGGFAIRRGDTDASKLSIVGGLIIAGALVIVKALFTAFGPVGSTCSPTHRSPPFPSAASVEVGSFQ